MNILYCGDDNGEDNLILSVLSLLKNVEEKLNVYVLTMRSKSQSWEYHPVSRSTIAFLDKWVKQENEANFVKLIDMTKIFEEEMPTANLESQFTPYSMLWLYADHVAELPDRILYMNMDVICRQDCGAFYHQDLRGYQLAGVLDHYGKWLYHNRIFEMDHLNSGVLLLNMKEIKETGLMEKCRHLCCEKQMRNPDQMAMNRLAEAKKVLPQRYNEQKKLQENTVFQQFTPGIAKVSWLQMIVKKLEEYSWFPGEDSTCEDDVILKEYASLLAARRSC